MKEIKFYKVNDTYGYISNFAPYYFSVGNKICLYRNIISRLKNS